MCESIEHVRRNPLVRLALEAEQRRADEATNLQATRRGRFSQLVDLAARSQNPSPMAKFPSQTEVDKIVQDAGETAESFLAAVHRRINSPEHRQQELRQRESQLDRDVDRVAELLAKARSLPAPPDRDGWREVDAKGGDPKEVARLTALLDDTKAKLQDVRTKLHAAA